MRDALSGHKKLLSNRQLCPVTVPRFKEFNATNLQKLALEDDELKLYLPDIGDNKVINRKFLFNVSRNLSNAAGHQHRQARLLSTRDHESSCRQKAKVGADPEQVHHNEHGDAQSDNQQQPCVNW